MDLPPVHPVASADADRAADALTAAFADDVLFRWLAPTDTARRTCAVHRAVVATGLRLGAVYATAGFEGVMAWLPPGAAPLSLRDQLRDGFGRALCDLGPGGAARLLVLGATMDAAHHAHAPPGHAYLFEVGVDPHFQGQGHGLRLLLQAVQLADARRCPTWLETQTEANVAWYRRHGFEVVVHGRLPLGGPPGWGMARPAR